MIICTAQESKEGGLEPAQQRNWVWVRQEDVFRMKHTIRNLNTSDLALQFPQHFWDGVKFQVSLTMWLNTCSLTWAIMLSLGESFCIIHHIVCCFLLLWQNTWDYQFMRGRLHFGAWFQRFHFMLTWPLLWGLWQRQKLWREVCGEQSWSSNDSWKGERQTERQREGIWY